MKGPALLLLPLALALPAAAEGRKAHGYLCEKRDAAGKATMARDVKSRKACKKSGGRWVHAPAAAAAESPAADAPGAAQAAPEQSPSTQEPPGAATATGTAGSATP